ncbi:MAG TPA: site-specific integrase, partial [Candidatus Blautia pullicola]|nr:site-specific integrase [Candidatus Blautia pullicola]
MGAEKDPKTGKWLIQYRYTDWQGRRRKSTKRGFLTKREAEEWLRSFLAVSQCNINMKFSDFLKLYYRDMEKRLREYTMRTKKYIMEMKILPYFGEKRISEITPADVRQWQNILMQEGYAETYLRTIHNQLAAVFNYGVKYYDLKSNPCTKAGCMGKANAEKMDFWTKQEFMGFIKATDYEPQSYMIFMLLYWTGMRIGEAFALTPNDIDIDSKVISISKSYQRIAKRDVITQPKTPKSKRKIKISGFLTKELKKYMESQGIHNKEERLFTITRYQLLCDMKKGIQASGVKNIRLHDFRHSHASLLVELGFSPLEIAENHV